MVPRSGGCRPYRTWEGATQGERRTLRVSHVSTISPELVLVSPDLAGRARAALPDRPWETFVPRLSARAAPTAPPPRHIWTRALTFIPALLLGVLLALLVVGSLPGLGQRPSLEPAPKTYTIVVDTPSVRVAPAPG